MNWDTALFVVVKCKIIVYKDNSLLICDNKNDNFENLGLSNRMNCSLKSAKIVKFEVFPRQKNENHV